MPFPLIPLLAMAASGVGTWLAGRNQAKQQNQLNLKAQQDAFEKNKEMWELQNKYNDPSAQMMRLRGAGLNPNLIYGSGSGTGNTTSNAPRFEAPQMSLGAPLQIPELLSQYQDFQMKQAQIDNVKAQTELTQDRTLTEPFNRWLREFQAKGSEQDLGQKQALAPYQLEALKTQVQRQGIGVGLDLQKLRNLRQDELLKMLVAQQKRTGHTGQLIDNERKQADLLFQRHKNEWIKAGVTTSDNLLVRVFVRMLNETGLMNDVQGKLRRYLKP